MISLTGDIATGKKVLTAAAKTVKRTHLELGGKAPVIVFDDADLAGVVEGIKVFGYYNAGQDCTAACRIYAGDKDLRAVRGGPLLGRFRPEVQSATRRGERFGPLISPRQRSRVASFVERAAELGHVEIAPAARRERRRLLLRADGGRGCAAVRRDRPARGVRPGGLGDALLGRRGRRRLGQR